MYQKKDENCKIKARKFITFISSKRQWMKELTINYTNRNVECEIEGTQLECICSKDLLLEIEIETMLDESEMI